MNPEARRTLNHAVRAIAHGTLGLDADTYHAIVFSIAPDSDGHITRCDDETALQVKEAFARLVEQQKSGEPERIGRQHRQIARLMGYLKWDWKATATFCRHMLGKRNTMQCDSVELSKLMRGMVAIIDGDLKTGKLVLGEKARGEYVLYTEKYRKGE